MKERKLRCMKPNTNTRLNYLKKLKLCLDNYCKDVKAKKNRLIWDKEIERLKNDLYIKQILSYMEKKSNQLIYLCDSLNLNQFIESIEKSNPNLYNQDTIENLVNQFISLDIGDIPKEEGKNEEDFSKQNQQEEQSENQSIQIVQPVTIINDNEDDKYQMVGGGNTLGSLLHIVSNQSTDENELEIKQRPLSNDKESKTFLQLKKNQIPKRTITYSRINKPPSDQKEELNLSPSVSIINCYEDNDKSDNTLHQLFNETENEKVVDLTNTKEPACLALDIEEDFCVLRKKNDHVNQCYDLSLETQSIFRSLIPLL
ncbi:hypothetical protein EDI_141010 [Entamoeba dispar SAW760]|uniref:Uncharacterized protein n=1 Tax=Entamoeba dispar (strain ATCC PRA-260 / SAW760) TaxID=370354 RepID=B0EDW4_ENTDS|nr:uncharacterized protein EDI_141010 [Entamoeba dispar SAW760]EDR27276.1 hypothetical protein EDI_141010 [Entamoeba dispar SAW760]|eukprot:EDR27276.1 hypothetical protein EDI_141010 [Entamoeba dispar SAW760]